MKHQLSDCHTILTLDQLKLKRENQDIKQMTNKNLSLKNQRNRQIFLTILQNMSF